LVILKIQCIF